MRSSHHERQQFLVSVASASAGYIRYQMDKHQDKLSGTGIALTYQSAGVAISVLYVAIAVFWCGSAKREGFLVESLLNALQH